MVLALLVIEFGLRIAGGISLAGQTIRNRRASEKGAYRILCLGESTTQNQWPPLLEYELNQSGLGNHFKVIDKGRSGTYTGNILSQLDGYLESFQPQMVVVMMGINDGEWVWKNPGVYQEKMSSKWSLVLANLRVRKMTRYILEGLKNRRTRRSGDPYREKGDLANEERMYKAAINTNPQNAQAYTSLGNLYLDNEQQEKAEEMYWSAIKKDPNYSLAYRKLAKLYRQQAKRVKAKQMHEESIKANPHDGWAFIEFGEFYSENNENGNAENMYKAALKADPQNAGAYINLGYLYGARGEREKEKIMYERAVKAEPRNVRAYLELSSLCMKNGEMKEAEEILLQGREAIGSVPRIMGALSLLYRQHHTLEHQTEQASYLPLGAIRNYQNLRDRILNRGIKLVCMQYPMRDVTALQQILGTEKGMIYVENKTNFENAYKTHKPSDIFIDMFAGDFGHCTPLGNRLIAKNLADVILRETGNRR